MTAILELRDLKKAFRAPGGEVTPILDVPAFALEAGAQVALEGRSGTGKTTLLHLVAGLLKPDAGSIRVAGTELTALSEGARDVFRARHVGYVHQTFALLDGYTALENVLLGMLFGAGADRARAEGLLRELGLAERLHHRPHQLSIGQRQRVAVARALAGEPELVLADEPTGSLDAQHAGEALALLREACAKRGAALLLVSHDPVVLGAFDDRRSLAELNRVAADAAQGSGR
ncbi:MAG: ABC transporter ATP-binding protein [Planctomycetes bacterium]|nr:ABC transporter ATP-binding protein [Planctomycetota bacterium]